MTKLNELLLDIFAFILHLAVFSMIIVGAGFLIAPIFGVNPPPKNIVLAVIFAIFAIIILVFDIILIVKRRFHSYLVILGITLTALLMWGVIISAYDMSKVVIIYLVVEVPLLVLKHKADTSTKTTT